MSYFSRNFSVSFGATTHFLPAINQAKQNPVLIFPNDHSLWISSPYHTPDSDIRYRIKVKKKFRVLRNFAQSQLLHANWRNVPALCK